MSIKKQKKPRKNRKKKIYNNWRKIMRIEQKATVEGIPVIKIRDFLRRFRTNALVGKSDIARLVSDNIPEGHNVKEIYRSVLNWFIEQGYLKDNGENHLELTEDGFRLAAAKASLPIKRTTADRIVEDFIKKIEHINKSDDFLFGVSKAELFGSYLSDEEKIGDVDAHITIIRKCKDDSKWKEIRTKFIENEQHNGKNFRGFYDELYWPSLKTVSFLKVKALSLHVDDPIIKKEGLVKKTVYETNIFDK